MGFERDDQYAEPANFRQEAYSAIHFVHLMLIFLLLLDQE